MDPDVALQQLRDLVRNARFATVDDWYESVCSIRELFMGLDEWLSRGGSLPAEWTNR